NVSIFETRWINLVFEGKNKEYGAYQLRQENPKTTVKALLIATFLFSAFLASPLFFNSSKQAGIISCPLAIPIELSNIVTPPSKKGPETQKEVLPAAKKEEPKKEINKENLVDPKVVEKEKAKTDIATNREAETNSNQGTPEGTGTTPSSGSFGGGTEGGENNSGGEDEGETPKGPYIEATLDVRPSFPGGIDNFYKYVAKNFKTPEMDAEKAVKVYVSFVIEKDGSMTDIRVPRNPGYGLDKEAIRVLKSLKTKWSPGMIKGKPVRTSYNLPINIQVR
ncbi:MAG: energy transducer TonB, partial [Flavobacterium sp.]